MCFQEGLHAGFVAAATLRNVHTTPVTPPSSGQDTFAWASLSGMTVLTLSHIELLLFLASFASPMPQQLDLDPGPVMQRHAGQMQVDRGQRGHQDTLARPSHGVV